MDESSFWADVVNMLGFRSVSRVERDRNRGAPPDVIALPYTEEDEDEIEEDYLEEETETEVPTEFVWDRIPTTAVQWDRPWMDAAAQRYSATKDVSLGLQLVERSLVLAEAVARRVAGRDEDTHAFVQSALVALLRALDGFDPARNGSFGEFAGSVMLRDMRRTKERQAAAKQGLPRIPRRTRRP